MQPKGLDCTECFSYSAKISHRMNKIQMTCSTRPPAETCK